ncbi:MAG TPA: folylpolyglutamate synthase/dihydrofolate synthase family protein [Caulobacteraceae bacterium]|nr:folylpolyglutamate synthase/dihydrofolate synthase family protein [Caulobacteraceae bacterium]
MERLCAALGNPERRLAPVVHVAGTNGKGSTVAFLRVIAEAAGLRVHVYTSPHLVRFNERIRLAGRLIEDEALAEALERVERANAGEPVTFFEITTAAAFAAFADVPADLCLLEVGLGGVLDATNVIPPPALSVIAPVDLDHREFLGDTVEQIATEKAGILKPAVPGVIGRQSEAALGVIEARAATIGSPLTVLGRDFDAWAEAGRMAFQGADRLLDLPLPSLPGPHQIDNAALAVAAALALGRPQIDEASVAQGLAAAVWPARMQRLTAGPLAERAGEKGADLWLDGGHNPHAARALADTLRRLEARDGRRAVLIAGMLANKDHAGFFAALRELKPGVLTVRFGADSAADPEDLAAAAGAAGLDAGAAASVDAALEQALSGGDPAPRVVICGSLYLAGEVLGRSPETWPT